MCVFVPVYVCASVCVYGRSVIIEAHVLLSRPAAVSARTSEKQGPPAIIVNLRKQVTSKFLYILLYASISTFIVAMVAAIYFVKLFAGNKIFVIL